MNCFLLLSICLNMIVKDEAPVIERCLKSVKPYIDHWVIVDTGSTDGTQEIIKKFMKDIPGELYEQPWVNFGHNRNEALKLAKGKGDYVLFIDADQVLEGRLDKAALTKDYYYVKIISSKEPLISCQHSFMINHHLDWRWQGVVHESLICSQSITHDLMKDVVISAETTDGHRTQDPKKPLKDARVLEKALEEDPKNAVYVFYIAQSYLAAGEYALALKNYEKAVSMGGNDEYVFWSKYNIGLTQQALNMAPEIFVKSYFDAYQYRPTRAEPVFRLALHFYNQKQYVISYALAKFGLKISLPKDITFLEDWIYSHGMLAVYANCALQLERYEEAKTAYTNIAHLSDVPKSVRQEALSTVQFIEGRKR